MTYRLLLLPLLALPLSLYGQIVNQPSGGGGGGSMTWPSTAGIMVYAGGSAYGTSLTAPTGAIVGAGQANTYTTGLQDLSAATWKIPTCSGGTSSATNMLCYASGVLHVWTGSDQSVGTAAFQSIGTSGATIPLLSTANTWGVAQVFSSGQGISGNAGTATSMTGGAVGSIPYQTAANTSAFLAGNTAATDQVVVSHGTGSAAQAPTMSNAPALSVANMTGLAASATTDTTNASNISTGTLGAGRLPSAAVQNAQANTYSGGGLQDMNAMDLRLPNHASDPGTCAAGQIELNTGSGGFKGCTATNTWGSLGGASAMAINSQSGTTYTALSSDCINTMIVFTSASAVTFTVPSGLGAGCVLDVLQFGAGVVTPTASSTTIYQRLLLTKTAGQYAEIMLKAEASNIFVMSGDLQ